MRKKIMSCFIALMMVFGLVSGATQASAETWAQYLSRQWSECETKFTSLNKTTGLTKWTGGSTQPTEGTGTKDDPYKIYTAEQFRYALVNKASLILMNDIDLGHVTWAPVNFGSATNEVVIDGKGHTVYNLYCTGSGGATTTAGLGFISYVDNPNFHMNNLKFRYAEVRGTGGNQNYAVAIAYFRRGHMDNVGVEDSLVKGYDFVGGLCVGWNTGFYAVDASGNPTGGEGTTIDHCHTNRVYTYGGSCIGNFVAPLWGSKVTNSYAVDGVTISTGGHSGGFISCPGYNYVENCFCNITMYGNTKTAVFSGVAHGTNKYVNCYASGVVEGTDCVGGFVGCGANETSGSTYYENCYSTTMVGMQSSASNMGGFVGYDTGILHFKNCYAAGEVGTLTTDPKKSANVGGFGGASSFNCTNCFYDKQTTAMAERVVGGYDSYAGIQGYQTKEILGTKQEDGNISLPTDYKEDTWLAHEGMYPQLNVFSNDNELTKNFLGEDKDIVKAYSAASVCTALLYPSNNSEYTDENYDTVRSIRYLFPFTNDELVSDNSFEVSWEADDLKCQLDGMTHLPIISLKSDTYAVKSLAPGVGWVTVKVKYYPNPNDKSKYTVGTRRLRLVPTTTLSVASAAGIDSTIWVIPEGAKALDDQYRQYDHRDDVNFCLGDALQLSSGKIIKEAYPETESFDHVALDTVGGFVKTVVEKQKGEEWEEVELTDDLKELFLGKRYAEEKDVGVYRFVYRWYASGQEGGAHLESSKQLTILDTYKVTYSTNDESNVETVDLGAYKANDTVYELPEEPKRVGYTFVEWNTKADGSGETFDKDSKIIEDVKVYAIWKANEYKSQYKVDDGEPEEIDQITNQPIKLPKEEPKKPGYSFTGWTPDPKGEDPYPDLDKKTILDLIKDYPDILDDDVIFYPVFEKNPDPEVTVKVENKTDPSSNEAQVYDILTYTITATNKEKDTKWKDVGIKNKLPEGLTLVEDSIKLIDPEGKEIKLNVKDVYNEKTRTIEVPIELIEGGTNYQIVYDVYINDKSLTDKDKDIHNTIEVEGKNPDGTPTKVEEETVLPEGGEEIKLADPKPDKKVTVENKTDPKREEPKKGDELEYTVEVTNTQENSEWKDGYIEEEIPEGVELIGDTIEVEYPDGHKEILKIEDVYDEETRTLRIPVGTLYGNESIKIKYNVKVLNEEVVIDKEEEPSEPKDKLEKENLGENVKTSDETNAFLFVGGMIISLIVIGLMTRKRREN